jgi:Ca2+-binding RTX toxin-like protein
MRRVAMVLGLAAVLVFAVAGVALAIQGLCGSFPCVGTNNDDVLYERTGSKADHIFGLKGRDTIDANTFNSDKDLLHGQEHNDRLLSNDGDRRDEVKGGPGRDICIIDRGDEHLRCEVVRVTRTVGTSDVRGDLSARAFR